MPISKDLMSDFQQQYSDNDSIQHRLRQLFDELGLTIYQIAKDTNENPSKFYNILNGHFIWFTTLQYFFSNRFNAFRNVSFGCWK